LAGTAGTKNSPAARETEIIKILLLVYPRKLEKKIDPRIALIV
jgi:hypothetical protein